MAQEIHIVPEVLVSTYFGRLVEYKVYQIASHGLSNYLLRWAVELLRKKLRTA